MPEKQDIDQPQEIQSLAFDYVLGTLRGDDRSAFERSLQEDDALREEVAFWEEHLATLTPQSLRQPSTRTWEAIAAATGGETAAVASKEAKSGFWQFHWLQWAAPTAAAFALMFVLFGFYPKYDATQENAQPNADYIAVLTDEAGQAIVSALTVQSGKTMWLKWESGGEFSPGTSRQLWAISKRDGQTRPIEVLDDNTTRKINLDTAAFRLVTDAEYLILTEEESGGSAIDEPSDVVLAKGVCVRFSAEQKAI